MNEIRFLVPSVVKEHAQVVGENGAPHPLLERHEGEQEDVERRDGEVEGDVEKQHRVDGMPDLYVN